MENISLAKIFYTFIICLFIAGVIMAILWVSSTINPLPSANATTIITPNEIQSESFKVDGITMNIFTKEYRGNNYTCIYRQLDVSCIKE